MTAPTIYIQNASVSFQHKKIFENLSLELKADSITCLLGPSGVGKTTLLRMIANLPLIHTEASFLSTLPHKAPHFSAKQKIALQNSKEFYQSEITTSDQLSLPPRLSYMAQTDMLLPWLTILDNVLLGTYLRGTPRTSAIKQHALDLLNSMGLKSAAQHKPAALSGGMRQRVALARTLMEDKPVVLMDEPFSALDAMTRYEMQTLAAQKLQGKTVLMITHDPWEALRLGHQIIVLRGDPASLSAPIIPVGLPPRDITDPALLPLQKLLLAELGYIPS